MRLLRYLLPLLVLAGIAFYILRGSSDDITVATVSRQMAVDAVPAIVNVRPEFQITLTSEVAGQVVKSNLSPGNQVSKDDILFEIDPVNYRLELDRLQKLLVNLDEQQALTFEEKVELDRKKEDLANFERLYKEGSYPELEIKRRREEFTILTEQQEKNVLARQRERLSIEFQIEQQKLKISQCIIKAPTDGTVSEIFFHPGELVSEGSKLVEFYSESLLVEARINEEDFSGIKADLEASVRFLAYGSELYPAKIEKVLPNPDTTNQQYRAYLQVDIAPERLIPGLSGEASIIRNRRENSLVIPRAAVYNGAVFLVEGGKVRRVPVQAGFRGLNVIEIIDGLSEGQTVAVSNVESLRDGQSVSVPNTD
ncbi:MAG: efflux RND transporter periplasmic adaptor subunit [Verrucomicrobiota bacterium]